MPDDDKKVETTIELAKRVGSKEAARIITEQKAKQKEEKNFNKTGQYYFELKKGGKIITKIKKGIEVVKKFGHEGAIDKKKAQITKLLKKGGKIKTNKMFVGGLPDPSTIVSKVSSASPQDYINYQTSTGSQSSVVPEERTGYKAVSKEELQTNNKPEEKSKGGIVYTKPHQKKYYGGLI